jgi:hypothetical protein
VAKLIKTWEDLVGLESNKYRLEINIDLGYGYIVPKDGSSDDYGHYLSTHTFYSKSYKGYEQLLQKCGFDIKLKNWA